MTVNSNHILAHAVFKLFRCALLVRTAEFKAPVLDCARVLNQMGFHRRTQYKFKQNIN